MNFIETSAKIFHQKINNEFATSEIEKILAHYRSQVEEQVLKTNIDNHWDEIKDNESGAVKLIQNLNTFVQA